MKTTIVSALLALGAVAFPAMMDPEVAAKASEIAARLARRQDLNNDPLGVSRAQTNCGPTPCLNFDTADQLVSVTGANAYASPAADEIRGPCPGLNAGMSILIDLTCLN